MCPIKLFPLLSYFVVVILSVSPVANSFIDINTEEDIVSESLHVADRMESLRTGNKQRKSSEKCEEYSQEIVWLMPLGKSRPIGITIDCVAPANLLVSGGEVAGIGEFPHMAAIAWRLVDRGHETLGYYCGGSLVSERWVLTAGHCTHHATMGNPFAVRLGSNRLSDKDSGQIVRIQSIKRHPKYMPPSMYADLALLKLSRKVNLGRNIKPACLDTEFDKTPRQAWVTGWGAIERQDNDDEELSDILLKAKLDIVDNVKCAVIHNLTTSVPNGVVPSMICAGDSKGGWKRDTCQGDSGGPLQIIHPNRCIYKVIGITSFGRLCATPDFPGVYTRISHYLDWIESIVWPD